MVTNTHKITHKLVIEALMESTSPLLMGKGEGDLSDKEMIRRPDGSPYIPASSFAGCLKRKMLGQPLSKDTMEIIWGSPTTKNNELQVLQSHLLIDDLLPQSNWKKKVVLRHGVKIASRSGIAETGSKYDYQALEPSVVFNLRMEITIREGFKDQVAELCLLPGMIIEALNDRFQVGAQTTSGFGYMRIKPESWIARLFDFSLADHRDSWFEYLDSAGLSRQHGGPLELEKGRKLYQKSQDIFHLKADFSIKSSLITGTYSDKVDAADKTQLMSNGFPVLSGKSIKGAIRHRARKILNTIGVNPAEILPELFGMVETQNRSEKAIKSRLSIDEVKLMASNDRNAVNERTQKQTRVRINRFTGGAMEGGLFTTEPLWKNGEETFTIHFRIDKWNREDQQKLAEGALLLHLLRDLWTEDLPVGGEKGIGRGILSGHEAHLSIAGLPWVSFSRKENLYQVSISGEKKAEFLAVFNQPLSSFFKPLTLTQR